VIEVEVLKEVRLVEVEVTVVDDWGNEACVLVREVSEAVVVVANGTVVLVLPEVVDVDSPLFDVVLAGEALSTPLEKRMQARTAIMP
jgi:hypothetical protein